jgi:hypothetical protein
MGNQWEIRTDKLAKAKIQIFRGSIMLTRWVVDHWSVNNLFDGKRRHVEAERCSTNQATKAAAVTAAGTNSRGRLGQRSPIRLYRLCY